MYFVNKPYLIVKIPILGYPTIKNNLWMSKEAQILAFYAEQILYFWETNF